MSVCQGCLYQPHCHERITTGEVEPGLQCSGYRESRPPVTDNGGYAGADWVRRDMRTKLVGEFGAKVADLLGWVFRGIYHLDLSALRRVDWSNEHWIQITLSWRHLSTFDDSDLTRLVIAAHDRAIRVSVEAVAPHRLRLEFHPRQREGDWYHRHPSIEDAIQAHRVRYESD